ncbi:conserved hypothetical protein [Desulfovibrionales bacterium]
MLPKILNQLEQMMPPLVARSHPKFKEWTGVGGRRMANLDCLGLGPQERMLLGREVVYPRGALLIWISGRLKGVKNHAAG